MKTLKQKDPLSLKQAPSSGTTYFLLVLSLLFLAAGIVLYVLFYVSPKGSSMRDYNTDLQEWTSNNLARKFGEMSFSYKILPVMDKLRDRDQFILDYRDKANQRDIERVDESGFFNYRQSYFWFNNSVKNFPEFAYDDEQAYVENSETFCLNVKYKQPSREKAYGKYEELFGLPDCKNSHSKTKYVWDPKSPTTGLNFKIWKRYGE